MKRKEIALFMTVGTGNNFNTNEEGFKIQARKLYSTINKIYPNYVVFFASDESEKTIKHIEELFKLDNDEFIPDEDYKIFNITVIIVVI